MGLSWCCSRLVWCHPYMCLFSIKLFCVFQTLRRWVRQRTSHGVPQRRLIYVLKSCSIWINLLSARERLRLEREERVTARLERRGQREQERRRTEQTEVRQARLDRQRVCDHERRAAEQPVDRQDRLDRQRVANFYLTHPFLDLVSGRSSSWQTAHARVGGVQPLNLEANLETALFGVSNFERRF